MNNSPVILPTKERHYMFGVNIEIIIYNPIMHNPQTKTKIKKTKHQTHFSQLKLQVLSTTSQDYSYFGSLLVAREWAECTRSTHRL